MADEATTDGEEPTNRQLKDQIGRLAQIVGACFSGLNERLDRFEERMDRLEERMGRIETDILTMKDSLNTIRREGLDMRASVDGLRASMRERQPIPAE